MGDTSQRPFWEAGGCYRDPEHPVVELFARQRIRHLVASGILDGVGSVLDVGSGSGFSSAFYPPHIRVVACDGALGMLAANPVSQFGAGPVRAFDGVVKEGMNELSSSGFGVPSYQGVAQAQIL